MLAEQAEKRSGNLTWLGLGLMSVQFGILARLTWWEYSWDIMEPGNKYNIHYTLDYDPLMMSQKEAPRKHPLVLSRKVAYLV